MGAHAEWFDTEFVAIVGAGWEAGDGEVVDHAIVVGFDNYAVVEGSLDELDDFADRIKAHIAARRAELAAGFIVTGDDPAHEVDVLYWSNDLGWIEGRSDATVFTPSEKDTFNLPIGSNVRWTPASEDVEQPANENGVRITKVGDTLWAREEGSDKDVRLKDLSPEDQYELLAEAGVADYFMVGKTVADVHHDKVPGQWGDEPATWLIFTDGTTHAFIHPAPEED